MSPTIVADGNADGKASADRILHLHLPLVVIDLGL